MVLILVLAGLFSTAPPTLRSGEPWYDTSGALIDAHGAGMLHDDDDGVYYWYGSARCVGCPGTQMDGGINLYSSRDLYAWKKEGLVLPVFNGSSATGNGLDLERPKVVRCAGTGKYVMWVRGTGFGNTPQLLAVATADAPTGPFTFAGNASDPFHTVYPGNRNLPAGYQYADATLFQDPQGDDRATYVYWRSRVNPQNTGFRAMRLTEDCLGVVHGSDTRLFSTPDREAPAVFFHAGQYFLWTSGTMGWSPTDVFLYASAGGPLGNFSASSEPGHGWHSYTKPAPQQQQQRQRQQQQQQQQRQQQQQQQQQQQRQATSWVVRDGYLPQGDTFGNSSKQNATLPEAKALCAAAVACLGFCFQDVDRAPPPDRALSVAYKTAVHFVPENPAAGMQPPPIPPPGRPGNAPPRQPGQWAFGSQSTYILPNPAFTPGSSLPQFVYMGDRWNYSSEHGTSTATYVWLPLFIDERNPRNVSVVWHDSWRLDNVTSPFALAPAPLVAAPHPIGDL